MELTEAFGPDNAELRRWAVRAKGNYGEIYREFMEQYVPRAAINQINKGKTGSGNWYALPTGPIDYDNPHRLDARSGIAQRILERGFVTMGVQTMSVIAQAQNQGQGEWIGLAVSYCQALSAALFGDGRDGCVTKEIASIAEGQQLAHSGEVDFIFATQTLEGSVGGIESSQAVFFDGSAFAGVPPFQECAEDFDTTTPECDSFKICVVEGSNHEGVLRSLYHERKIMTTISIADSFAKISGNECKAIIGNSLEITPDIAKRNSYSGPYGVGVKRFSNRPWTLQTTDLDQHWSRFVFWAVNAIVLASELGISESNADEMPQVDLYGQKFADAYRNAIARGGNVVKHFARHAIPTFPIGGRNSLNAGSRGRQHNPLPTK